VDKLAAKLPVSGLPVMHGRITLMLEVPRAITSIQPFKGQEGKVSELLKAHHGAALPATGRMTGREGKRVYWAGQGVYFLTAAADATLATHAALVDLTDGWTCFSLRGEGVDDVMAHLTPLDTRVNHFKRGHVARTELMHMMSLIARTGPDSFDIMVMRSFARTAAHDLTRAMKIVAARQ